MNVVTFDSSPRFCFIVDCKLEQAGVALFIVLLKNMLQCHLVNQEAIVREHALAILGVLLQKVYVFTIANSC